MCFISLLFPLKRAHTDKSRRTAEAPQGVWSGVVVCVLGGPTETASACAIVTDTGYLCPASVSVPPPPPPPPTHTTPPHKHTHPIHTHTTTHTQTRMHTLAVTISSRLLRHHIHYLHPGFLRLLCRGQPVSSGSPPLWSLRKHASISPFRHTQPLKRTHHK